MSNKHDLALWQKLQEADLVQGEMPNTDIQNHPWYLRSLQGFTGWFAAWFILGSIFALFYKVLEYKELALVFGVATLTGAYFIYQKAKASDFIGQFALAISLTGQSLCIYAWRDLLHDPIGWWLIALMSVSLAWLMPSFIHRFLSSSMAIGAILLGCMDWPIVWLLPSIVVVAMAAVWLAESKWLIHSDRVRPIAYALTMSALQIHSLTLLGVNGLGQLVHGRDLPAGSFLLAVNEVLLGFALVATVGVLLKRYKIGYQQPQAWLALVLATVLGLVSQQATGLAVAWILIVIGFANGHRVLLALGVCVFWGYLARYYYFLNWTLLDKSYLLMATGAFLLIVRQIGQRWRQHHE